MEMLISRDLIRKQEVFPFHAQVGNHNQLSKIKNQVLASTSHGLNSLAR